MTHTVAQRCILFGVLVVLLGGIMFLTSSPSQETEHTVTQETTEPTLPNRPPEGYQVPLRPEVTFPFTHVSADRLRLANVRRVPDGEEPVLMRPFDSTSRSPDGQWKLLDSPDIAITRTDGSGEIRVLLEHDPDSDRKVVYGWHEVPLTWSWDSKRIFYKVERTYYVDESHQDRKSERWLESVDIATGETIRHKNIGLGDGSIHSLATARYPHDPVIHFDRESKVFSIGTYDGSVRWMFNPNIYPASLSPNKQMIFTRERDRPGRYHIYTVANNKLLHNFTFGRDSIADSDFLWSPDSTKFVYEYSHVDGHFGLTIESDLYLMNVDGTGRTRLTNTPDIHEGIVGWTSDGQIVFVDRRDGALYLADLVIEMISPALEMKSVITQKPTWPDLPDHPPKGYQIPPRPEVTLPFTNVSADRLRLANIRQIPNGKNLSFVQPPRFFYELDSLAPDGEWILLGSGSDITIMRADGSGETRVLLKEGLNSDREILRGYGETPPIWSWDSKRIFYKVERTYYVGAERQDRKSERWIESVDIATGEIIQYATDIGFDSNVHSFATARHPHDLVVYSDYDNQVVIVGTYDGSAHWRVDYGVKFFSPYPLSPNKQMILVHKGYKGIYNLIRATDGNGFLYDLSTPYDGGYDFRWSPDSTKLVYHGMSKYEDRFGIPTASEIYIINADGTGRTQLTDTPDISERVVGWTLDGQLVFVNYRDGVLYLADLVTE